MALPNGYEIGNYRISKFIGSGGLGDVYLAMHLGLQQQRALKVLRTPLNAKEVSAFEKEARQLAKLKHPNILTIYDYIFDNGTPIIVTEYAPGGSLRDVFDNTTGPKLIAGALPWIKEIAAALQYAHTSRLVHRDVKPDNILIDALGNYRLADFGLAVMDHATVSRTSVQIAAGTPLYASPEQSRRQAVPASDQYSLACMTWEWLHGEPPFQGDPMALLYFHLHELPDIRQLTTVSDATKQVLLKALAKNPTDRFLTIDEFANVFIKSTQSTVSVAPAQTPLPVPEITCQRCGHANPVSRQICSACGSALTRTPATQVLPTQVPVAITPQKSLKQGDAFSKAVEVINAHIVKHSGRDQYSFDYSWLRRQCGIHGSLSRLFLNRLVEHYKQAGWLAWLYENQHDMSGVAEDPAFVLDVPGKRNH